MPKHTKPFASLVVGDNFKLTYSWNKAVHVVKVLAAPAPYNNGMSDMLRARVQSDDGREFYALGQLTGDARELA